MDSDYLADSVPGGPDPFRADCPSREALAAVSGKWACLVICALRSGPLRHMEIARRVEGVSPRSLSHALRDLESRGLVRREAFPETPPRVVYSLTPLGRHLSRWLEQLRLWAAEWGAKPASPGAAER